MTRNLSPELLRRIDSLSGCQGRWIVDCRELEGDYSYALRRLQEPSLYSSLLVPVGDDRRCWALYRGEALGLEIGNTPTPEDAALYCAHTGWKSRLLFVADLLDDDCSWPGGYSAPSTNRSNARVFRDQFSRELELADGDADGVALDVRYLTAEMLETLEGLEDYPLISDDDHSQLEMELQAEAWESWAASDWRQLVCKAIDAVLPEDATTDGDEILSAMPEEDSQLAELFRNCCDWTNTYWFEDGTDQWIDLDRVGKTLDVHLIRDFTGLQLLSPDQAWRFEPYPWPGADPAPLLVADAL